MALQSHPASNRALPISTYQRLLLDAAQNPETRAGFHENQTIRWAFRIKPTVPQRTLRRAFDKLVARHDSLRLRFVETDGDWLAEILSEHQYGLKVEDLSHLPRGAQDAAILEMATRPMTALSDPMFEMILIKCGKAGDVVLTRAHHAILDGYSVVILIEELLKIVLNMPLPKSAPGHEAFITRRQERLSERAAEKEDFWLNHLLPLPEDLNIGRKAKGLPPGSPQTLGASIRLDDILSPEQSALLEERAKTSGVSSFSSLHAAFSMTICKMADQAEVVINTVLGRQDAAMAGFVGPDMQLLVLKYTPQPGNIIERGAHVAKLIAAATEQLPTLAFMPERALAQAMTDKGTSRLRFLVHMPHPTGRLANSPFKKLFNKGMKDKLSLGLISLERVDLPGETETDHELVLTIRQTTDGPIAALVADGIAFSKEELAEIADGIRHQLGFDQD
jgi:hypothetical protein